VRLETCNEPPPARTTAKRGALRGTRALVVDDNSTNRRILSDILTTWELQPTACCGASEAITQLRHAFRSGQPYELLLSDVNMPHADGFMLLEQVRRDPSLSDITAIMLTSGDRPEDATRAQQLGVGQRLMKPIKQSELYDAILDALNIEPRKADSEEAAPAVPTTRPLRLLLAEDSLVNQRLAVGLLERHGHRVTIANNGRQAVDLASGDGFDAILMDVQMPEMDGLEAARRIILELDVARRPRLIALTANVFKADRDACLAAGMDDFLSKPMDLIPLREALRHCVQVAMLSD
jgi:CheY-like chemotaxis protein